jgi:hypothetical protein
MLKLKELDEKHYYLFGIFDESIQLGEFDVIIKTFPEKRLAIRLKICEDSLVPIELLLKVYFLYSFKQVWKGLNSRIQEIGWVAESEGDIQDLRTRFNQYVCFPGRHKAGIDIYLLSLWDKVFNFMNINHSLSFVTVDTLFLNKVSPWSPGILQHFWGSLVQRAIDRSVNIIAGIIYLIATPPIVSAEMIIDYGISLLRVRHQLFK